MKRVVLLLLALVAVVGLAVPASAQTPAPQPPKCQGALSFITCNGIVSGVVNTVGGLASGNPAPAVSGAIQIGRTTTAAWMRGTVGRLVSDMGNATGIAASAITYELDGVTIPKSFPSWFMDTWGLTKNLAFQVLFLCYVIAIIAGVLKANLARVIQTPVLAAAIVGGMALTLVVVSVVVQAVDWAASQVLHGSTASIDVVMNSFGSLIQLPAVAGTGSNVILTLGVLFLSLVAFAIVWFNLLVRKWIIYIATGMFALALSGSLTKAGAKWLKFLAVLLGTVIVSKLLLVVILAYGVSALAQPSSLSDVAGGGSVFLLSGLAPWVLVTIVFGGAMHALHGGLHAAGEPARMGRDAVASARRTHNHWESFRSHRAQREAQRTQASHAALAARGKAAANSVFEAQVSAAARKAATATPATATVATAVTAAKKVASAAKRTSARVAATKNPVPAPSGYTQTRSGLLVKTSGQRSPRAPQGGWTCPKCGSVTASSLFKGCQNCGAPKP